MLSKNEYILNEQISYICQNEYQYFLKIKNVVGIAIGHKITKGFYTSQKCITVFVLKKLPKYKINYKNLIPENYKQIPTDVVESGMFKMHSLNTKIRPVVGGYSIGTTLDPLPGTLACLVKDSKNLYMLSNNHVLANNNTAPINTPILQPSIDDGGKPSEDVVGVLSKFIPLKFITRFSTPKNTIDCAIAKVINKSLVSSIVAYIGTPQSTIIPRLNESVEKSGRTTSFTRGTITNINATIKVLCHCTVDRIALFTNQIVTTKMCDEGDSGALLVNENKYAVGLLVGGSQNMCVYNNINIVLKELNVRLVTT